MCWCCLFPLCHSHKSSSCCITQLLIKTSWLQCQDWIKTSWRSLWGTGDKIILNAMQNCRTNVLLTTCRCPGHNSVDQEGLAKRSRIRQMLYSKPGFSEIYIGVVISGMVLWVVLHEFYKKIQRCCQKNRMLRPEKGKEQSQSTYFEHYLKQIKRFLMLGKGCKQNFQNF